MTLENAIENFDSARANSLSLEQKMKFISQLDHKINDEYLVIRGGEAFIPYTSETSLQTELKAPESFSEIYTLYLNMQLDYMNGEIARFNNSAMLFNHIYKEMGDTINRKTAVQKKTKIKTEALYV